MCTQAKIGMKQSKKIAVTGGIGSGKSTVLKILADKEYAVFSCDSIYADLLKDKNFIEKLSQRFGDILDCNGNLDRKKLAAIVFNDDKALADLNKLTHPAIYNEMFKRADETGGVCFCEVPLLFEDGSQNLFDDVIVVMREKEQRIKSVSLRDNLSEDSVVRRIKSQFDYNNGNFEKYYVIHNNRDMTALTAQIDKILVKL